MNTRVLVLFLMLNLCGRLAASSAPVVTAPTLEGDPRLPAKDIESVCTPEQWQVLRAMPYRALVILDVQLNPDGSASEGSVRTHEPDDTWTVPARAVAKPVRLKASSAGSHIRPAGEIFVIFYGQGPDRRALVYGQQRDAPLVGTRGKARYIAIEKY